MDNQLDNEEKKQKFVLRSDFTILLFLSIQGLLFSVWVICWIMGELSKPSIYRSDYSFGEVFSLFLTIFLIVFFINFLVVMLSTIVHRKWWVAIPVTCLLLGMPLISRVLTLIGAQIARLFYIPTVEDLQDVRDNLKMKIKPRKKYILVYEEYLSNRILEVPYYFSLWQSTFAALLGGFLGGGLMLSVNYKQLGDKKRFIIGVILSVILQFLLIFVVYLIRELNEQMKFIYILPFLLFIPTLCNLFYSEFLHERFESKVSMGKVEKASMWSLFGVFLISLIFEVFCLDPVAYILRTFGLHPQNIFF